MDIRNLSVRKLNEIHEHLFEKLLRESKSKGVLIKWLRGLPFSPEVISSKPVSAEDGTGFFYIGDTISTLKYEWQEPGYGGFRITAEKEEKGKIDTHIYQEVSSLSKKCGELDGLVSFDGYEINTKVFLTSDGKKKYSEMTEGEVKDVIDEIEDGMKNRAEKYFSKTIELLKKLNEESRKYIVFISPFQGSIESRYYTKDSGGEETVVGVFSNLRELNQLAKNSYGVFIEALPSFDELLQ